MIVNDSPTVTALGKATVRRRPSRLVMVGSISGNGTTLQLSLEDVAKKKQSTTNWLYGLKAEEINYGEPRFPDQVEPNPYTAIQRRRQLRKGKAKTSFVNRIVLVTYSAIWSIEEMTSDEIMIFSDRLRFESANDESPATKQDVQTEEPTKRDFELDIPGVDEMLEMQRDMMSELEKPPAENRETYFLFLSRLPQPDVEKAVNNACQDARSKASIMAKAVGKKIGELNSVSSFTADTAGRLSIGKIHREQFMPMLQEVYLGDDNNEIFSENPKAAEFNFSIHLTFQLV